MKTLILAALKEMAGAPAEFQLLPEGKIEINGDAPAFLDEASAQGIIDAFKNRGNDMVIDYEHQTMIDVQAPAAGWVKQLVWKGKEGLWVVVDWTKRAKEYLENREYRYFSPVLWITPTDRKVILIENVALTNQPKINNLKPIMAKLRHDDKARKNQKEKEEAMFEKLKKLLSLANDAAEEKVEEAVTLLIAKNKELEGRTEVVACKEILEALGAKDGAGKDELLRIVASMKAPADAAVKMSLEVAELKKKISEMEQTDLIQLALKEGKTSPEELDNWGRDLALKSPEQFKKIVLSRPAGSVIPVESIQVAAKDKPGALDDVQREVNRQMGIDEETFKKYNK